MTRNQIEYSKLKETQRANRMQEGLTRTRDTNSYLLGTREANERERHNRATERVSLDSLAETQRANRAQEALRQAETDVKRGELEVHRRTLDETARANLAREGIQRMNLDETRRSNLAKEGETERANRAREQETAIHDRQTEINQRYASQMGYAATQYSSDRNFQAQQNATYQRDLASQRQLELGRQQLQEKTETDRRQGLISMYNATEIARANRTKEGLSQKEIDVKSGQLSEMVRHNMESERELGRHNQVTEDTEIVKTVGNLVTQGIRTAVGLKVGGLLK